MKIKNINGTSQNTCKCGSWLNHWKKYSGQSIPTYCPVTSCMKKELLGAHVQLDNPKDKKWYIYPLCRKHNATTTQTLDVSDTYRLVSANVSETCG